MTTKTKLELRASEIRSRLAEIAALEGDDFTDEVRSEATGLHTEMRATEERLQAAIVAEPEGAAKAVTEPPEDSESRERRALRGLLRMLGDLWQCLIDRPDLPPRVVPHPMLVPAPVEGREGRASSGTRATA